MFSLEACVDCSRESSTPKLYDQFATSCDAMSDKVEDVLVRGSTKFHAVDEYEPPTRFFRTKQSGRLSSVGEPNMTFEGRSVRRVTRGA